MYKPYVQAVIFKRLFRNIEITIVTWKGSRETNYSK